MGEHETRPEEVLDEEARHEGAYDGAVHSFAAFSRPCQYLSWTARFFASARLGGSDENASVKLCIVASTFSARQPAALLRLLVEVTRPFGLGSGHL